MSKIKWQLLGALALAAVVVGIVVVVADGGSGDGDGDGDGGRATPRNMAAITLTAAKSTVRLGDREIQTWAFNGRVPGPEIRLQAGQAVRATVRNQLPAPLTIHWHGIALRNDMDGAENVTQKAIGPGEEFVYEFTAPDPGTYFYHPHTGTQLDRGLYAPLIVEDPAEDGRYDRELNMVLDDWTDGVGEDPDAILARLERGMSDMPGMGGSDATEGNEGMKGMKGMKGMPAMESAGAADDERGPLGADTGDVDYPLYLVNGRPPSDPAVYDVKPGERVRVRLINAASDTPFRVAAGDQRLSVIATDGFPVRPVSTDSLLVGMGERYDVVVDAPRDGSLAVVAQAEGKNGRALAVLRTGDDAVPKRAMRAPSLDGEPLALSRLRATPAVAIEPRKPDRTFRLALRGTMQNYDWRLASATKRLAVGEGDRVRLVFANRTDMWHPMHLHGTTFQVRSGATPGPRKDTVIVPPRKSVVVDFDADNPGRWLIHCHNIYHAEAGMTTELQVGDGAFLRSDPGAAPGGVEVAPDGPGGSRTMPNDGGGSMEDMGH